MFWSHRVTWPFSLSASYRTHSLALLIDVCQRMMTFMYIPHFHWDFLTPSFLQLLFELPCQNGPFLYFHSMFSTFRIIPKKYLYLIQCYLCLFVSILQQRPPLSPLSLVGFCFWWTVSSTICLLPSFSSLSAHREIQYELLSLLQGQGEREGQRKWNRQKEINRPERG